MRIALRDMLGVALGGHSAWCWGSLQAGEMGSSLGAFSPSVGDRLGEELGENWVCTGCIDQETTCSRYWDTLGDRLSTTLGEELGEVLDASTQWASWGPHPVQVRYLDVLGDRAGRKSSGSDTGEQLLG
jgi:hypothetical protein